MQVRQANQSRRDQAAITVLQTALSQNSVLMLEMFGVIRRTRPLRRSIIFVKNQEQQRAILELVFSGSKVTGFMVHRNLVDLETINEMAGGTALGFWSRAGNWIFSRRERTGHLEFLEWCEWLAQHLSTYRATHAYEPAHLRR